MSGSDLNTALMLCCTDTVLELHEQGCCAVMLCHSSLLQTVCDERCCAQSILIPCMVYKHRM